MAVTAKPLTVMPSPGPTNMIPASAGAPSSLSRARHQPEAYTKTRALATPASPRHSAHDAGHGNAMLSVSSTVAASPKRTMTVGSSAVRPQWRHSTGCKAQPIAPSQ